MFKEGKFYAIQGQNASGDWVYLEAVNLSRDNISRLRRIARRHNTSDWDDYEYDEYEDSNVKMSESPFGVKHFVADDIKLIVSHMRHIRKASNRFDIDSTTLRIVVVETSVQAYIPEPESSEEIILRTFALDKLSQMEKDLLKVVHWEVYHKLNDRSMLDDPEEEE